MGSPNFDPFLYVRYFKDQFVRQEDEGTLKFEKLWKKRMNRQFSTKRVKVRVIEPQESSGRETTRNAHLE